MGLRRNGKRDLLVPCWPKQWLRDICPSSHHQYYNVIHQPLLAQFTLHDDDSGGQNTPMTAVCTVHQAFGQAWFIKGINRSPTLFLNSFQWSRWSRKHKCRESAGKVTRGWPDGGRGECPKPFSIGDRQAHCVEYSRAPLGSTGRIGTIEEVSRGNLGQNPQNRDVKCRRRGCNRGLSSSEIHPTPRNCGESAGPRAVLPLSIRE